MLLYDVKRSLLSKRMLVVVLFGLVCLYQPTLYLKMMEDRWIWESDLISSLQDALGLGIFEFCAPATAALCASALYVQDRRTGVLPLYIARVGRRRYIFSKLMCCGLSGALSLALPILIFSFLQFALYAGWKCAAGDWKTIFIDVLTYIPYGFLWATVGLALSTWTDSAQVAYAAPYAIAMTMKTFSDSCGQWLDPSRQVSPLNGTLMDWRLIVLIQMCELLLCVGLLHWGVRRCAE